jgi:hypothetical protein
MAEINTKCWKINYKSVIDDDFIQTRIPESFIKNLTESNWYENQNTFVSVNVWEFLGRLKMFYNVVLIK